ncbi:MAG: hypothetical protein E7302_17325 [Butyrivibrio sp.]|nr:hypothetical protein [Butyrivibrio sp.]
MNALQILCEEDGDLDLAHRVANASSDVAKCFDMGVYQEISKNKDGELFNEKGIVCNNYIES